MRRHVRTTTPIGTLAFPGVLIALLLLCGGAPALAACGDHLLEAGETCTACPDDCKPAACKVADKARPVRVGVDWAPPTGQDASSLTLKIAYRTSRVALPGSGGTPQVRLEGAPANAIVLVEDLDYAVKVVLTRSGALEPGRVFTLAFDRCDKAPAPEPADFSCTVEGCATSAGDVKECTCNVVAL